MAKGFNFSAFIAWIVGILVSLAVGSGMIQGILDVPFIPGIITILAGWIVVIGAIISVIAALFGR
jgi:cytosine/uracil/thiamine/allantoin permease